MFFLVFDVVKFVVLTFSQIFADVFNTHKIKPQNIYQRMILPSNHTLRRNLEQKRKVSLNFSLGSDLEMLLIQNGARTQSKTEGIPGKHDLTKELVSLKISDQNIFIPQRLPSECLNTKNQQHILTMIPRCFNTTLFFYFAVCSTFYIFCRFIDCNTLYHSENEKRARQFN
jgi:hypothetical protein